LRVTNASKHSLTPSSILNLDAESNELSRTIDDADIEGARSRRHLWMPLQIRSSAAAAATCQKGKVKFPIQVLRRSCLVSALVQIGFVSLVLAFDGILN
jgi:hypothetical protein